MTSPSLTLKMLLLGSDTTASAALGSLATKASSLPNQLAGPLSKLGSMIGGEVGELTQQFSEFFEKTGEDSKGLGAKLATAGAGAAGIGAAATLIGSKDATAQAQLKQSITDTGGAYSDYQDEIEKTISKQENFGNSAVSTQNALATLTSATGDPTKAIENMGLVSDLAAAKHEDLGSAASQVAKVLEGTGTKTLKQYGITTTDVNLATQQLADKLKGQASASVDSWGGKLDVLKTKIGDQVAILGQKFGPALTAAGSAMTAVGAVTQVLKSRQEAATAAQVAATLATKAGGAAAEETAAKTEEQTVATEGQSFASKAAAAAQWLFNAAMDANPIVLIIIAVVALVAAIIYIATKTTWFQTIWHDAWGAISGAFTDVWDWITGHWPLIIDILTGPIGVAVQEIVKHWGAIKDGFTDVKNWISDKISDIIGFFTGLGGKIASATKGMFNGIADAYITAINWIINKWNGLKFSTPNVPGTNFGGVTIGMPHIDTLPMLAMGGDIASAGRVVVGDKGPEMLDLPQGARVTPLNRAANGGQFGQPVIVHSTILLDGRQIGASLETLTNTGAPLNIRTTGR